MKWTKFTLETTTEAVDLISDMLCGFGIEGIEISDKVPITEEDRKRLFADFLPDLGEDDGLAVVTFYVDLVEDPQEILLKVNNRLAELSTFVSIGSGRIEISETEDKDWINNWKQFFKPFHIDDMIVIKPTWEEYAPENEQELVIEMDPGISFGTGSHETTKLCILNLKKYLKPGDTVLDAGSGSGILSIIAKKLGAGSVLGIDIDPIATDVAIRNAKVNHVDMDNLTFITGNIIEDKELRKEIGTGKLDLVVANILAEVIISLAGIIGENLKSGGIFISSGIINTKKEAVESELIKNGFTILEVNRMGDWVSFTVKK